MRRPSFQTADSTQPWQESRTRRGNRRECTESHPIQYTPNLTNSTPTDQEQPPQQHLHHQLLPPPHPQRRGEEDDLHLQPERKSRFHPQDRVLHFARLLCQQDWHEHGRDEVRH
jgi:hypothetical protein